jgi:hypothetical protein
LVVSLRGRVLRPRQGCEAEQRQQCAPIENDLVESRNYDLPQVADNGSN